MYKEINEGKVKIIVPKEEKISKDLPVFYNPVMKFNRDISVLLLNCIDKVEMQIGLPLAGSGVRGVRFLKELDKKKIKTLDINDFDNNSVKLIKKNLNLNKVKCNVSKKDANMFLLESKGFDYIDIDPFGSPNFLLNNSMVRLSRDGILAVTATDTGCLCGSFVKACRRKYWAEPLRSDSMHEVGLRILIRKVQLIGAQFDKALVPVFSYSKDHYFRVFFRCSKGKEKVDILLKEHGMFGSSGPMWLGKLWDIKLVGLMCKKNDIVANQKILDQIKKESKIDVVGIYDMTKLAKKHKVRVLPKQDVIVKAIKKKGFKVSETHFRENSIRTDISEKELVKILK